MSQDNSGQSFAEYLNDAPLAPDPSAKLILRGEVRRSPKGGKFVFSSPELGTVELDVDAVLEFEALDNGVTSITLDATSMRNLTAPRAGTSSGRGLVPFVMATPHRASADAIRDQLTKTEMSAAIMDVETFFVKDVWGDDPDSTVPLFPF
jgi:hypothetical protein